MSEAVDSDVVTYSAIGRRENTGKSKPFPYNKSNRAVYKRFDDLEKDRKVLMEDVGYVMSMGEAEAEPLKVPAATTHIQRKRLISLQLSSLLSGASFAGAIYSLCVEFPVSPFFFMAFGFPLLGVSVASLLALFEGRRYDT